MPTDTTGPVDPIASEYIGDSASQIARRWFNATRPKFFPASVLPVLAGTAWGTLDSGNFDSLAFILALLATIAVHAGANVLNDVGDESNGTDRRNTGRIYPYTGGSRFIQVGIMDVASMTMLGTGLLAFAAVCGFFLLLAKGPMVLAFGVAGIALAVLYSIGPLRLSALGLGELAVAIGFGILPVAGAAWLQSGTVNAAALVFAVPISAWVADILLINEVPDIEADGASDKRTLAVRLGHGGTAILYLSIHVFALLAVAYGCWRDWLPIAALLVPALLMVPAVKAAATIRRPDAGRADMTRAIESTLMIHTVGCIWLIACVLYVFFTAS